MCTDCGCGLTDGNRHGAVVAQGLDQGREVDFFLCFAHLAEVDQHRIVVEEIRVIGQAASQILRQCLHVGAAKHDGKHRQLRALEVKAGALGAGRFNRHGNGISAREGAL